MSKIELAYDKEEKLSSVKKQLFEKWFSEKRNHNLIQKRKDIAIAPLSSAQQRLWLLEQISPGSIVYNMHDAARIDGKLDSEILHRVFTTLIERHEILRTEFVYENGYPVQKINKKIKFEMPVVDLSSTAAENKEALAFQIAQDEIKRPFDLEKGYLFRVKLIRLNENDQILIWTMHHIISDGWSLGIIIKEVLALIRAYTDLQAHSLPSLPIQYGDFSFWETSRNNTTLDAMLDFWRSELSGEIPVLNLPTDRPRPIESTYYGKRYATLYPKSLGNELQQLAQQQSVTLFMVLLAAFQLLLYRYSAAECIHVGVPVANRNRSELHHLIGYFSNTVVMRATFNEKCSFDVFLQSVKRRALAVFQNQDISFEKLVEAFNPERSLNRTPLFQAMFAFQNEPMPSIKHDDLIIEPVEIHNGTSKFDLLLNIFDTEKGLNVGFEYSTDLYDECTIKRMLEHYRVLLENIVKNPLASIDEIPLISDVEKNHLLYEWNKTDKDYLEDPQLLHHLFQKQVVATPNAIAVSANLNHWNYQTINESANKLAHYLISEGVEPNSIVAIYIDRSVELVIALLATLKSGAVFLPLDKEYPDNRLFYMLDNSAAPFLLYKNIIPDWADQLKIKCINVENKDISYFKETNPTVVINKKDNAYVIYTSGSTGQPKGAINTHQGICNRLLWMQEQFNLKNDDRVLQKTPCGFDVSVWEFFWPLISGATLVLAPMGAHKDVNLLADIICSEKITTIHFVPSLLRLFLQNSLSADFSSLRRVICSGEALSNKLVLQFSEKIHCDIYNLYGPTEAAIDVTFHDCSKGIQSSSVPIGRPIDNTKIYILDNLMQPVPIGVPGELYISGIAVGNGYLNNPVLTQERFIRNPFSNNTNEHLYKTGDVARFLKNGDIEFLGRKDFQIKLGGSRIELQEIESIIHAVPGVDEAVVSLYEKEADDKHLVAYMTLAKNSQWHVDSVDDQVGEWAAVFNKFYHQEKTPSDSERNYVSWNSSYTGKAFSELEMDEWVNVTVNRIREKKPKKILEIGCGTGLLLLQLAKETELYVGTDISNQAIDYIHSVIERDNRYGDIKLFKADAVDLSSVTQYGPYDIVILNSVVQYFPSIDYFIKAINGFVDLLSPNGYIYLGDIRNHDLNEIFYASILLNNENNQLSVKSFQNKIQEKQKSDQELSLSPNIFRHLSIFDNRIKQARVMVRRGAFKNEMTRFRYDVFLQINHQKINHIDIDKINWSDLNFSGENLNGLLNKGLKKSLQVKSIPNARVYHDSSTLSLIRNSSDDLIINEVLKKPLLLNESMMLDPEMIWKTWEKHYEINISWSADDCSENMDVIFVPKYLYQDSIEHIFSSEQIVSCDESQLKKMSSSPGLSKAQYFLIKQVKTKIKETLPQYMLPSMYIFLEKMPLSANGKIDRLQLPKPFDYRAEKENNFISPKTDVEKSLAFILSDILKTDDVGITDNFFDLGGNSLLAARLILKLKDQNIATIPLRDFFQNPTIEGITQHINKNNLRAEDSSTWNKMQEDCFLPASITTGKIKKSNELNNTTLLTGATGFLGSFLLRDLLKLTSMTVICLIRSDSRESALFKLQKTLKQYELDNDIDFNRIEILVGDLSLPYFGMIKKEFSMLSERVDTIYHCAASVNFAASYEQLRPTNVIGTNELFRFSALSHIKSIHLVSSIYALTSSDADLNGYLTEESRPRHGNQLSMGYLQTKYVTENLAYEARALGIPVNVYRPGRISGDRNTGACQIDDFYWNIARICLLMRAVPNIEFLENIIPVDSVSESIIHLSLDSIAINKNYHHTCSQSLSFKFLFEVLKNYGYGFEIFDYEKWCSHAINFAKQRPDDTSTRFVAFLLDQKNLTEDLKFSSIETEESINKLGMKNFCSVEKDLLCKYINYFISKKFFPSPEVLNRKYNKGNSVE